MQQQWTPTNPREPWVLTHEIEQLWTSTAYALAECGVENRILEETYEMAKTYTDDRYAFEPLHTQFLVFFHNYISNQTNKARLTTVVGNWLNEGNQFPFEIRHPLGFA
jgi:hypothetical protein